MPRHLLNRLLLPSALLIPLLEQGIAIESQRRAWEAQRPERYQFEYRMDCFCMLKGIRWRVTVQANSVLRVEALDTIGVNLRGKDFLMLHPTIDKLFAYITSDAKGPRSRVTVTFDSHWHYPSSIFADPDTIADDDDWGVQVGNLVALK